MARHSLTLVNYTLHLTHLYRSDSLDQQFYKLEIALVHLQSTSILANDTNHRQYYQYEKVDILLLIRDAIPLRASHELELLSCTISDNLVLPVHGSVGLTIV